MQRRLALSVLEDIRISAPHAINGLSNREVDARFKTAIGKATRYELASPDEFKGFVRLCFVVGPNFDEYGRFKETLMFAGRQTRPPILELFCLAEKEDWHKAAQFDIVGRYREPVSMERSSQERTPQPESSGGHGISLTPLDARHAEAYFAYGLHPDVWRLAKMKPLMSLQEVQRFILEQGHMNQAGFAVVDSEEFLGAMFVALRAGTRWISYWIARPAWGKGIATHALKQLTATLCRDKSVPIMLRVEPGNIPSIKVAEKCGFKRTDDPSGAAFIFEA